jgi:glycosyltransferase involved in cell wall biosynthesis
MSMMLLEVATLKVPIICSDIYENKFIFDENEVLYFSSGDYSDLARKLAYAEDNKNDLMQRAELAYQKVSTQYNWCNISREYAKIYSGLLKNDKKY